MGEGVQGAPQARRAEVENLVRDAQRIDESNKVTCLEQMWLDEDEIGVG